MTWDMNKKILTSLILFMLSVLSLQAQELDDAYNTPKRSNEEFADYMVNVRNKLQKNWNNLQKLYSIDENILKIYMVLLYH